jgi:hypothetical protein
VAIAEGRTLNADGTISRRYSAHPVLVPLPLALREHPGGRTSQDAQGVAAARPALQPGDKAVFVGLAHLGATAMVLPAAGSGVDQHGKTITSTGVSAGRAYLHQSQKLIESR